MAFPPALLPAKTKYPALKWLVVLLGVLSLPAMLPAHERPNILWLVAEDINPRYFSAYGDPLAVTPRFDRLAREGTRFTTCHSTAPVCAPSRFSLITGLHATSCGPAQHMRAQGRLPAGLRGFPALLREAGYFTTNNAKTDYNAPLELRDLWDESSPQAHWRHRRSGQPFFAVCNFDWTHESMNWPQSTSVPAERRARVRLPAWAPDTDDSRAQLANNFELAHRYDAWAAEILDTLAAEGLAENTILFLFADNGGTFLRSKRFLYDEGTHVPLVVHVPKKWQRFAGLSPGQVLAEPVSFVDFAPTVLSLAGVPLPLYLHGRALAGPLRADAPEFVFAHRDRMGEAYDTSRAVKNARWCYIRNFLPRLPHGQPIDYQFRSAAYRGWRDLHRAQQLTPIQDRFWQAKPSEELYDLERDPEQLDNLASTPAHQAQLERMRLALRRHLLLTHDNGFMPEGAPCEGFDASRKAGAFSLARILSVAEAASSASVERLPQFSAWLGDPDGSVRWWAAQGLAALGTRARPAKEVLMRRLADPWAQVRVVSAEALILLGDPASGKPALLKLLHEPQEQVRLQAALALERVDLPLGESADSDLAAALKGAWTDKEVASYLKSVVSRLQTRRAESARAPSPPKAKF